ncbi:MAG TPA: diiron oxygenase, partial [Acidimicrobiia bacterium]|nr:diiron oxygenase [Acidimicrobiia bacterium]
ELPPFDPLARTEWYRSQPPEVRARIGLYRYGACMKIGWHFENLLQRGLLGYASRLPNGALEFRYAHHELIEESQHTLMFQEFVNRSGLPVRGMPGGLFRLVEAGGVRMSRLFPPLFFVGVLAGEDPVDHLQRLQLQGDRELHPLVERIMRIHITEEARHLSFARHLLTRDAARLSRGRRAVLSLAAPVVLGVLTKVMIRPPGDLVRHFGIPKTVARQAFRTRDGRRLEQDAVAKSRRLLCDLGLVNRPARLVWRAMGIWARP